MGLDFSHCDAMWGYSSFNEFRDRLQDELPMHPWRGDADDPIQVLLNHSNCEGIIEPWDCGPLASRLSELVHEWDVFDFDRESALSLAGGLRKAASKGEQLEFR